MYRPRDQIQSISRKANPPRVNRGRLAEDYDGIGQYVLISLAQSSPSAALKARVASGDYGTGQQIPAGTEVTIISYRGHLEIVSMGAK